MAKDLPYSLEHLSLCDTFGVSIGRDIGRIYDDQHDMPIAAVTRPLDGVDLIGAFLRTHFALMAELEAGERETAGTTASLLTYDPSPGLFITANLGDSLCGAVIISEQEQCVRIIPMTTEHSIDNPDEKQRIIDGGGQINEKGNLSIHLNRIFDSVKRKFIRKRWRYAVSSTGGFGDDAFGELIRRTPDIRIFRLYDNPYLGEESLNAARSDIFIPFSLTDGLKTSLSWQEHAAALQEVFFKERKEITARNMVKYFLEQAIAANNRDNKSIVAATIMPGMDISPFLIGTGDAHGGELLNGHAHPSGQIVSATVMGSLYSCLALTQDL